MRIENNKKMVKKRIFIRKATFARCLAFALAALFLDILRTAAVLLIAFYL
jgi:hypothetical protein